MSNLTDYTGGTWATLLDKPAVIAAGVDAAAARASIDAAPNSHVGSNGTAHAVANTSVAGFMSAADKTKLDGIATAATANATDAALRDRATHTGTQAISTVTGLDTALAGKAPLDGTGTSGSWPISVTGNAATATKLTTARTINGVSFDGTANITVADSTKLPTAGGTMTGAITFAAGQTWPTFNQSTTGNAATATKLATARKINGTDFDGTADITISSVYDPTYTRMVSPAGGVFTTTNSVVTGAITVVLPVGSTNTMTRVSVKIYEYTTNESFEVCFGGYIYSSGSWINEFAYIIGNPSVNRNFTVRLGKRADGRAVAYIGELSSTWSYPQVFVTDAQLGYGGMASWGGNWAIEFTTAAFESVSATITNSQIGYSAVEATANTLALRDGTGALTVGTLQSTALVQLLNGGAAQGMKMGSLTVSNSYADNAPSNGIYSKGVIQSGVATGTAPFTITSTTRVDNLNVASAGVADSATKLTTARTINGVSFDGSANITVADSTKLPLAGGTMTGAISFAAGQTWPTFNQSTTGNAATATKLATARTIGGVSFDGSANIVLPGVNTTGNQNTTGNAATATKLATARTINGVAFDGTADVTITAQPVFAQQHSDNTSNGIPFAAGVEYSLRVNGTYSRSTPASPAIGDKFILNNLYDTWGSGLFTLTRGSPNHKINNIQEDVIFDVNVRRVELTYIYANEWIMAIS